MKKKNVINLIKYYTEHNDAAFRAEAYDIAHDFDKNGDFQLAEYVMALLSNANTFIPQMIESKSDFFVKVLFNNDPLPLPEDIKNDLVGAVNAVGYNIGVNKFLFQGPPGTGKTETVKQFARLLGRELYAVDFDSLIDSKLGQTSKNIANIFEEINNLICPDNIMILFDEIDAIALDRTNSNDLRDMGRATSSILKGFDNLNNKVVLVATTNLYNNFDKALVRRFDSVIDFDRYTKDDLYDIAEMLLDYYLTQFKSMGKNKRLFRKIIELMPSLPYPGVLKNIIKTSLAFSNPSDEFDYFKRLYKNCYGDDVPEPKILQEKGFTVREIEILTDIPKSSVSRELRGKE